MSYRCFQFVLTLVATNAKNYKYCRAFIQNIFDERKVSVSHSKNLSNLVIDIYFNCYLEDFNFMRKKIYSLNKKADLLMQRVKYRKKKLLVCDMDMTIINVETIDLINDNLLKNNQIPYITKDAMSGNISFRQSIITRTKLLKGIKKVEIINLIKKIKINEGVKSVIRTMNNYGNHTILISGGYDLIANSIGKKIGFKEIRCNTLEVINNQLTGNLGNKILDKKGKLYHLKNSIKKLKIKKDLTLAVGDGDNDIDMIKHSGLGVAWNAYEKVKLAADVSIRFSFKSLLYFQGFTDKEILN